ncbi:MAG: hypothetical protein RIT35_1508 [Pseudomonadota bacterium]|jgi:hypothetical protein
MKRLNYVNIEPIVMNKVIDHQLNCHYCKRQLIQLLQLQTTTVFKTARYQDLIIIQ